MKGPARLIVSVSSSAAVEYGWHVAYGVGKAARDRVTADTAKELKPYGISCGSLWPRLVMTERNKTTASNLPILDYSTARSPRFSGRAVAAMTADSEVARFSGQA
jgi:dehydrogenase/reductase SDR family protein 1